MGFVSTYNEIEFIEKTHQYFYKKQELLPVSSFLKVFEPVFPRMQAAMGVAKRDGISIEAVLKMWDEKRDKAAAHGTKIHNVLEQGWIKGKVPLMYSDMFESVKLLTMPRKQVFPEKMFFNKEFGIAGTADQPQERCKKAFNGKKLQVIDIFDYKTNTAKGVTLYDSRLKYGKWVHDMKYFNGPISHLEYTLYNKYALQMSIYALMCEWYYDVIIGRLGIVFIDLNLNASVIPTPYLKHEAESMFRWHQKAKPLPQLKN